MPMGSIVVLGGGGFVGRHIVSKLVSDVYRVIVPTRRREAVKHLIVLPTVDVVEEDIHDPKVLERRGCDIHLALLALDFLVLFGQQFGAFFELIVGLQPLG